MFKYFRLYKRFLKINAIKALTYRGHLLIGIVLTAFESITVFMVMKVVYSHIQTIAGWSYHDTLVLIGIFMLTNSFGWLVYYGGLSELDRIINRGDFDWFLAKPIDTQFISTCYRIDIEDASRSLVGVAIMAIGLQNSSFPQLIVYLPFFILTFIFGQMVLYSIKLALKTISFKSIQGWATNSISWRFHALAQYPTDIYTGIMKRIYTYFLPLLFIATVPAKALLGKMTRQLFLGAFVAAVLSFFISRQIWKLAVRSYSSASS